MQKILIHYFSGTGNTEMAVKQIREQLEKAGLQVELHSIESGMPPQGSFDAHLFAFPVYSWTVPSIVKRYIRALPKGEGVKTAVFASFGGHPSQALNEARKLLQAKGYSVFLDGGVMLPDNWTQMMSPPDKETCAKIVDAGLQKIPMFTEKFIKEEPDAFVFSKGVGALLWLIGAAFLALGRRILGKFFIADSSCNGCELCAKACPVGCIRMAGDKPKRPTWHFNCEDCCRCINICPQKSIQFSLAKVITLSVLAAIFTTLAILYSGYLFVFLYFLPGWLVTTIVVALVHILVLLAQYYLVDPLIIRLQKLGIGARFWDKTFTRSFHRYTAPGFKPPLKK